MFKLFRGKKQPEIKPEDVLVKDHDLNLLMLMGSVNESEYRLGKISAEQYWNQCAELEVVGLKLTEKHIQKLEEKVNVVSNN